MCQGVFLLVLIYDDKVVELEIDFPLSPVSWMDTGARSI